RGLTGVAGTELSVTGDPRIRALLERPNHAVVSTLNADGSIHAAVVWVEIEEGRLALNSVVNRAWAVNLVRDPRVTVVVADETNPYDYVEVRGTAVRDVVDAEALADRLAQKYLGEAVYPFRKGGEERVAFLVEPQRVRYRSAPAGGGQQPTRPADEGTA
ncbi:MAG: pyridoxamine 5-phosphate oxidase-related FMN-binding, partial [Friedmanniella sp.]|nr:pyridoxamine 5-phosphate oxidase-related FMN-binding [Friedmanniella sp.]